MNKNLPICGSAVIVIVLVLASLSPVVGFHTVKSSVKDSPLFAVRTRRAIDAEEDSLTCDYVGKGELMPFPQRDNQIVLIQKILNRMRMMDDASIGQLIDMIEKKMKEENYEGNPNNYLDTVTYPTCRCTLKWGILGNILWCLVFWFDQILSFICSITPEIFTT